MAAGRAHAAARAFEESADRPCTCRAATRFTVCGHRETSHSLGCVVSEPLAQRAGLVVQRPVVLDLDDVIVLRPYLGVGPRLATAASYAGAMHACTAAEPRPDIVELGKFLVLVTHAQSPSYSGRSARVGQSCPCHRHAETNAEGCVPVQPCQLSADTAFRKRVYKAF
jgi:hypothetical protein